MILLQSIHKSLSTLAVHVRARRLAMGLTQEGLAKRSGVPLPTLRKFEQMGQLSLESFLKLLMVVGGLEAVIQAAAPEQAAFPSIDAVIKANAQKPRKKGWRK